MLNVEFAQLNRVLRAPSQNAVDILPILSDLYQPILRFNMRLASSMLE
jgi:hypothetical protein